MDPKDELLAKLKAIDAEANPPAPQPELKPVSPPAPAPVVETAPSISTNDFLAKLEALDQSTRPTPPPIPTPPAPSQVHGGAVSSAPSPSVPPPSPQGSPTSKPAGIGQPIGGQKFPTAPATQAAAPSPTSSPAQAPQPYAGFPNVIERLKQFTQEQLAAHAAQNQAKAKRAQEISRAQAWLDQLDPLSDDGFWFEQFAERYESRIQAALDFLNPGTSK